jgi:hypothetical protein
VKPRSRGSTGLVLRVAISRGAMRVGNGCGQAQT